MKSIKYIVVAFLLQTWTASFAQVYYGVELDVQISSQITTKQDSYLGQMKGGSVFGSTHILSGIAESKFFQFRFGIGRAIRQGEYAYINNISKLNSEESIYNMTTLLRMKESSILLPLGVRYCVFGTDSDMTFFIEPEVAFNIPFKRRYFGDINEDPKFISEAFEAKDRLKLERIRSYWVSSLNTGVKIRYDNMEVLLGCGLNFKVGEVYGPLGSLKTGFNFRVRLGYLI